MKLEDYTYHIMQSELTKIFGQALSMAGSPEAKVKFLLESHQSLLNRPTLSMASFMVLEPGKTIPNLKDWIYFDGRGHSKRDLDHFFSQGHSDAANESWIEVHHVLLHSETNSMLRLTGEDEPEVWYSMPVYKKYYEALGYSQGLYRLWLPRLEEPINQEPPYAKTPIPFYITGMLRHETDPEITPEEKQITDLFFQVMAPLIDTAAFNEPSNTLQALTQREKDVLKLALEGHSESEMANRMFRSTETVHSHMKNIYRKFSVSSRAELMAFFIDKAKI